VKHLALSDRRADPQLLLLFCTRLWPAFASRLSRIVHWYTDGLRRVHSSYNRLGLMLGGCIPGALILLRLAPYFAPISDLRLSVLRRGRGP
jgi:hypothetical protein